MTMKRNALRSVLLLAALAVFATPAAEAQKTPKVCSKKAKTAVAAQPAAGPACPADDGVGRAGFRAFIDPQTGQLRQPTPEEAQALSRAARKEFEQTVKNLQPIVHPDGTISVDLQGLFMQDLVAVKNPDGSLSIRCVPDSEKATALAIPAPPRPAPRLEER
jgi:hypothetical protein